jgi:Tol biopolymer transport system component
MLFNIAGQLAVADFTTGGLTWLPTQEGAQGYTSAGWTSSTVVAYGQYRPGTWQSLLFFDVLDPQRRPVGLEGVAHSLISPDRSKIAFTTDFGSLRWTNLREGLVAAPRSAQATPIQTVDENVSQLLTWSPDGRFILYSRFGDLRMVDVTTGAVRALPDAPALHNATFDSLLAHWSPDGQWLVFLQNTYSSVGQRRGQALRMKPDGSEGLILTEGRSNLWLSGFLAGGQIVAVMRIDRARLPTATLLIDLAAGKTIRTLPGEFMASDADGKALVFAQKDGVYLLRDVTDPGRPPEKLLDRACRYGWWNLTSPGP